MFICLEFVETFGEAQQLRYIAAWIWEINICPVPLLRLDLVPEALTGKWQGLNSLANFCSIVSTSGLVLCLRCSVDGAENCLGYMQGLAQVYAERVLKNILRTRKFQVKG